MMNVIMCGRPVMYPSAKLASIPTTVVLLKIQKLGEETMSVLRTMESGRYLADHFNPHEGLCKELSNWRVNKKAEEMKKCQSFESLDLLYNSVNSF
jgi:hypothetical protein